MERFFGSNPGFRSRIAHHIDFPDYTDDELLSIAEIMLHDMYYKFTDRAREAFVRYLRLAQATALVFKCPLGPQCTGSDAAPSSQPSVPGYESRPYR